MKVTLEDIQKAQKTISSVAYKTALHQSRSLTDIYGRPVYLKFENQQMTGSFKIRGALNKISSLTTEERKKGIIASSAGNHAQGAALAAARLGVTATIVMPKTAPLVKIEATKSYGAKVILHGDFYDEAYEHALKLQTEQGLVFVHPYNDPFTIAGQGTIGLEIFEDAPDIDTLVVPIGGGGLISGIAVAMKSLNPKCRVLGVQTRAANSMMRSYKEGKLVEQFGRVITIADGVAVKKPSQEILDSFLKKYVDDVVDVSEDDIAEAIVFLMERAKTVVEGSGALPLAALKAFKPQLGTKVALILSGGNIDLNTIEKVVHRGLLRSGRLAEIRVSVEDRPGTLKLLTTVLAENGCNVLEVWHDRNQMGVALGGTTIDFLIETSGLEHADSVRQILQKQGYTLL